MHNFFLKSNTKFKHQNKGGKKLKATGVVRRIDDLGRVVIPKEIRKTLRIKEGDPLETTLELLRILTESLQTLALQN
jgi:AbrB family looped-hinge helix DNA binding protein